MYLYRSKNFFFKFSLYRKLLAEVTFFFREHITGWALYELAGDIPIIVFMWIFDQENYEQKCSNL